MPAVCADRRLRNVRWRIMKRGMAVSQTDSKSKVAFISAYQSLDPVAPLPATMVFTGIMYVTSTAIALLYTFAGFSVKLKFLVVLSRCFFF